MKCTIGWCPAVLAVLFHVSLLSSAGAAKARKRRQPVAGQVAKLRAALDSQTEELASQKNIAHGLELEVRELQSELQSEKKALATEKQKEQGLQQKLNRVRVALDDGPLPASKPAVTERQAAPAEVESVPKPVKLAAIPVEEPLDAAAADADMEPAEELAPAVAKPQQQLPVESAPAVHARQTTAQEPPPFFEAAALQSASAIKTMPPKAPEKKVVQERKPKVAPKVAKPAVQTHPKPAARQVAPKKAKHAASFRGSAAAAKASSAKAKAMPAPTAPKTLSEAVTSAASLASPAFAANTAAKDSSSSPAGADFDALEQQLHEEDRRIQDLDQENALDAMSDGPPAAGSPQGKSAQPKLELDAEAPMEDLLNVEAPATDAGAEAAPGADSAQGDQVLALPQEAAGAGLEGAFSDNQFLSQIAPSPKH